MTLVIVMISLAACASRGGYYKDDGPPRFPGRDIDSIPDAVPRDEPLSRTGNNPYVALGQRYTPMSNADNYRERGIASWYGRKFHGKRTSSGEKYDMYGMTAAHRTLPLPSYVTVTNLRNRESVVVRVNDRGPFLHNRLIDLSYAAAHKLGIIATGTGHVEVRSLSVGRMRMANNRAVDSSRAPVEELDGVGGRFYVQFGAFSRPDNARALMRKLQQIGIRFARIEQGSDGYFRVRSGPFSSEVTAEHLGLRGADLGFSTTIVTE